MSFPKPWQPALRGPMLCINVSAMQSTSRSVQCQRPVSGNSYSGAKCAKWLYKLLVQPLHEQSSHK